METKSDLRTTVENGIEIMHDANEIKIKGIQEISRVNRKKWYGSLIMAFIGLSLVPLAAFFFLIGIIGGGVFWYYKNKQIEKLSGYYNKKVLQIQEECEDETQIPYDYCDLDTLSRFQYYLVE